MSADKRLVSDGEILKKYPPALGPEGLQEALEGLWQKSQQDPHFASREHFLSYQLPNQPLLILMKVNTGHPFIWFKNTDSRPLPKNVKETIARFLWENAGEKEHHPQDSFEQWRDDKNKNAQWLSDLSQGERDLLMEGGILGSLPPDPIASIDATLTAAKLPAQSRALEGQHAQEVGMAGFDADTTAALDKLGQQQPPVQPGLLSTWSVFAPKPQVPPKPAAPAPQVDHAPESLSEKNKGPKV